MAKVIVRMHTEDTIPTELTHSFVWVVDFVFFFCEL
jgi:hypothetical protein